MNDGSSCDSFILQGDRINPTTVRPWLEMPMEVTSEGEGIGGFAWPHMTFVWVWPQGNGHHDPHRILTYLKTSLLEVTFYPLLLLYKYCLGTC
jgi:hypothetical protein